MNTIEKYADWTPYLTPEAPMPYLLKVEMGRAFVRALFSGYDKGWIDVRCLQKHKGRRPRFGNFNSRSKVWTTEEWFPLVETVNDPDYLLGFAFAAECDGYDVYVGVLPRGKHGEARKANIYEAGVAWAEMDFDKQGGEAETRRKADEAKPDMIVHSGGGLHLYWMLKNPVAMTAETARGFELSLKARQRNLGCDSVHDITRVLRIPGTQNWKIEGHPRPVRLIKCP